MRIFFGLLKEVWKSFNSRLKHSIGITNNVLDHAFYEKQYERFHRSFFIFHCSSWALYIFTGVSSYYSLCILMANAIPGDIDGFLGATILEFTTVSGGKTA